MGFSKSEDDPNLYFKVVKNQLYILVQHVYDLFPTRREILIVKNKRELTSEFEMKDLGLMHYFLGLMIWQRNDEIFYSQEKYTLDIL